MALDLCVRETVPPGEISSYVSWVSPLTLLMVLNRDGVQLPKHKATEHWRKVPGELVHLSPLQILRILLFTVLSNLL